MSNDVNVAFTHDLAKMASQENIVPMRAHETRNSGERTMVITCTTLKVLGCHVGAQGVVTWQPSTFNVVQVITIVLSPEFRVSWALIGTMFSWDAIFARSCVNATLTSFDILGSEPAVLAPDWLTAHQMWILLAALVATATEGAVMGALILRGSRKH